MSAASKLIRFGTAALFHAPIRTISATPSLCSLKPFAASQSLRFPRYSSSSAAIETIDSVTANSTEAPLLHPWPEWVAFIDRLKTKGYFTGTQPSESDDVYTDMTQIKDACLSFARDRYDVFKWGSFICSGCRENVEIQSVGWGLIELLLLLSFVDVSFTFVLSFKLSFPYL